MPAIPQANKEILGPVKRKVYKTLCNAMAIMSRPDIAECIARDAESTGQVQYMSLLLQPVNTEQDRFLVLNDRNFLM